MFCPQCGQQQVSDEARFCSRCGFQLQAVTSLLSTGGLAPSPTLPAAGESPRLRGVRQGVLIFFVGLVVTAVFGILFGEYPEGELPGVLIPLSAVILVLGGILRALYALIFAQGKPEQPSPHAPLYPATTNAPLAGQHAAALPAGESIPARAYAPTRARTAEIAPPPSVTENTTRLLRDTPEDDAR